MNKQEVEDHFDELYKSFAKYDETEQQKIFKFFAKLQKINNTEIVVDDERYPLNSKLKLFGPTCHHRVEMHHFILPNLFDGSPSKMVEHQVNENDVITYLGETFTIKNVHTLLKVNVERIGECWIDQRVVRGK